MSTEKADALMFEKGADPVAPPIAHQIRHIKEALPAFDAAFALEAAQRRNPMDAQTAHRATVARIKARFSPAQGMIFAYQLGEEDMLVALGAHSRYIGSFNEKRLVNYHYPLRAADAGRWVLGDLVRCSPHIAPTDQESRAYLQLVTEAGNISQYRIAMGQTALTEIIVAHEPPQGEPFDPSAYLRQEPMSTYYML